jgi:LmbE family N-acetylglucosaminyl deacetylase
MADDELRVLCLHAHYDDFEFVAGGTFELLRRRLGSKLKAKVIVCTDGKAGHHFRTRDETGNLRLREQEESAKVGGYEFEPLRLPNGEIPREACLRVSIDLLAALWKAIRAFEPHYIVCPPICSDPLAGMHVDHVAVGQAVREVAYMINVPHAFTLEYPTDETKSSPCRVPVILNCYDRYQSATTPFDLGVDTEAAWDVVCAESFCHHSQIAEWLPWVGRHDIAPPKSMEDWSRILRARHTRTNREMRVATEHAHEFFTVTAWGEARRSRRCAATFPRRWKAPSRRSSGWASGWPSGGASSRFVLVRRKGKKARAGCRDGRAGAGGPREIKRRFAKFRLCRACSLCRNRRARPVWRKRASPAARSRRGRCSTSEWPIQWQQRVV